MSRTWRDVSVCTAILVAIGSVSCSQPERYGADVPPLVAHRGASALAPENTLAAFELAWELGADMIEADFYLTSDGAIVAFHDETTERTGGVDRRVEAQTLAELRSLDVGSWKGAEWAGERVPTLAEVLATVPGGRAILIELKSDGRIVPALKRAVAASALEPSQVIVISFDADTVAAVNDAMPAITTYWISDFEEGPDGWHPTTADLIETARRIGADGVDVRAEPLVVNEAMVRAVHEAGLELHVWTVNEIDVAREMADLGVDSITTDRPGWVRERLEGGRAE